MASKEVAEHYNGVRQEGIGGRTQSRIFYQRNMSNWIKSQLIDEVMSKLRDAGVGHPRVLDLACGKGGDLKKWKIARASSVVMADVASVSIEQAKERYEENKQREGAHTWYRAQFIVADCTKMDLAKEINDPAPFDVVSCQFALHYSFIDETSARRFLKNATQSLKPGGYFIGTLPDAERIVWSGRENDGHFGNDVCKIRFENKEDLQGRPPLFGCKFHFSLDSQVNCPEFLCYFPLLEHLLSELGMKLVMMKRFPDAIAHWRDRGRGLMGRMQALEPFPASEGTRLAGTDSEYDAAQELLRSLDPSASQHVGTLSKSEWEAVCMYLVFIFKKEDSEVKKEERKEEEEEEPVEAKKIRVEEETSSGN